MAIGTLVEELKSADGAWKAEIWKRDDGTLHVELLRWHAEEILPDGDVPGYWGTVHTAASITDTIDRAKAIANELLSLQPHDP